ncbi:MULTISPECIES: reprolysin-like metallopeptidase [Chryseobacterium]|uniref:reprolysin-like metallopeptidase n=1 Tax=Chryseobacterium TaxID=59732 RepID=UPI000C9EA9C4|nr:MULTISPECIES: zinc-dependent metalloprotease family protein [Chryseobacterium]VXA97613.1 Por secretion system C-terminal sorting domain-containing protein [Chryseobacterium sp. 8AT]
MKKLITALFCGLMGTVAFGQWTPAQPQRNSSKKITEFKSYYKLDLAQLQEKLKNAQEMGRNSKFVEISLPTLSGKIERFAVYSFPVVVKELADKYQLGSYVGVGIDDPSKYLRFSVAPNDFQSMIINNGEHEFIDAQDDSKTIYGVHPKTINTKGKSFVCSTDEGLGAIKDIEEMSKTGNSFTNQPTDFSKMSDKKYRTMRLAMSVTGEYTQFFGGVAGALAQINATMTRVNGVFEKDFALHLNVLSYPALIYDDPATDGYDTVTDPYSFPSTWNLTLQQKLTQVVGNDNYDIGHLFGASGGGGSAGCIGCVCINPTTSVPRGKGSGITSPATGSVNPTAANPPAGDTFDIDYVAHEMGHQLGANHTFSHALEPSGVNMEPGSGSTIMGYAGITGGPATDVQPNSNAYFHKASITQVQTNLNNKTCDVETTVNNNPPVIAALPTYNIPKGTAFVLTASATDTENDPLTYTWEQVDNASVTINSTNLGSTTTGASFRSFTPTTNPTRYFPKLASVLNGVLDNANSGWESVSKVARTTKFAVTVRDNNPDPAQQQTQFAEQTIVVGDVGPFRIFTQFANTSAPTAIEWDVAGTTAAPYSVANVKIDYTTDNGTTWTVLFASTPNDGTENFTFPASLSGQTVKLRISSIGNVFYAVSTVQVSQFAPCSAAAPASVAVSNITANGATVSWAPVSGATYVIRYKKVSDTTWQQTTSTSPYVVLSGLSEQALYEVQVAVVCSGNTGAYSSSVNFTTKAEINYCDASTLTGNSLSISNVTFANINNTSNAAPYTNFTANPALQINLVKGTQYPISITSTITHYNAVAVFIDYNRDGVFTDNERAYNFPTALAGSYTGSITVPATAIENQILRMRVILINAGQSNVGASIGATLTCGTNFTHGEVEDYNVVVAGSLSTNESSNFKDGIQIYPNPATDFLNVTKVSDKATYKIYSAAGQLVGNGNINNGKINVSSLIKGAYVISIEDKGKESFNSKFIKK